MPCPEAINKGFQLWINLPSKNKMIEPKYKEIESKNIPKTEKDGVHATVIAGSALGVLSPSCTCTSTMFVDFSMKPPPSLFIDTTNQNIKFNGSALEELRWLLEMEKLFVKTLSMQDWMSSSVRNSHKTRVDFASGEKMFHCVGQHVISKGFTFIMPWLAVGEKNLAQFTKGESIRIARVNLYEGTTSPQDYFSESELISLMEKYGTGTDASIPGHINNLCERNYVQLKSLNNTCTSY